MHEKFNPYDLGQWAKWIKRIKAAEEKPKIFDPYDLSKPLGESTNEQTALHVESTQNEEN